VARVRIALLKLFDRLVGGMATAILPAPAPGALAAPRRLLLIRPGGIGDAVLLIPAIFALRQKFPEAEITVLAERRNAAAFSLCPAVDLLLLYDTPVDLVRAVRGGYDVVIDTEQWHRLSAVVSRLTRAPVSIGFASNERQRLFSHRIGYSHDDYEAQSFFKLLAPLGITPPAALRAPFLVVPGQDAARADALLAPLSGGRFVVIFPGASIAERRWGAERFREVARRLAAAGIPVVVVGGGDDAEQGEVIVQGTCGLNLAGRTTLAETAAVIARSSLLLSGDSGVLHIAVGLAVPTVSLFGPGIEAKWGPQGEGDLILNRHLACSPCTSFGTTPSCPTKARCLCEITVPEVVAAVASSLGLDAG
jgi:heptosyltransferase II